MRNILRRHGVARLTAAIASAAIVLAVAVCGCGGGDGYDPALVQRTTPGVHVTISPPTATVPVGGLVTFQAQVSGSSNTAVTWMVADEGGGTIAADGDYTASNLPGTYHIVATSVADPTQTATAVVTVQAQSPGTVVGTIQ